MPRFIALCDYNRLLFDMCEEDAYREHYRHDETIAERFTEDLKQCLKLPEIEFDTSGHMNVTTDGWGKFYLNKKKHAYSTSPKYANTRVNLQLTSQHIIVMDENYKEIVRKPGQKHPSFKLGWAFNLLRSKPH